MFFIYDLISRPVRSGDDRHHDSRDVMVLLCHVTLLDHALTIIMGKSP